MTSFETCCLLPREAPKLIIKTKTKKMSTPKRPAPPPPTQDLTQLKSYFDKVDQNKNGLISATELKSALTNGFEDFPFQLSTVNAIMHGFAPETKEVNFETFVHLWKYIFEWQKCFRRFDTNKSGSIESKELQSALTSFGYNISSNICQILMQRFDRSGQKEILFDDFIKLCLILHGLTDSFRGKDVHQNGQVNISFEDFLQMVFSCGPLFQ